MPKRESVKLDWKNKNINYPTNPVNDLKEEQIVYPFTPKEDRVFLNEILDNSSSLVNGRLIAGDNQKVMGDLLSTGYEGKFDLIYLDPPYFSDSNYKSNIKVSNNGNVQWISRDVFRDSWSSLEDYLNYILPILQVSKRLLTTRGNLFVHLDWHASHYIKVLLDEVFSRENFINEIVWCYGGGSNAKRHFHRKHDIILWYVKSDNYIFNPQYRPYTEKTKARGLTKVKGPKYALNKKGALMHDWWTDINKILSPTAYENLKFPTQKPAALLERIIKAGSNEGSLVGDFFIGSGTTAEVAGQLNRDWVACDNSPIAIQTTHNRLINSSAPPYKLEVIGDVSYKPLDVIIHRTDDLLTVSFPPDNSLISRINFWEIGLEEQGVFKSIVQLVASRKKPLPQKLIIKNFLLKNSKLMVKAYDYWGNVYIKEQPLH